MLRLSARRFPIASVSRSVRTAPVSSRLVQANALLNDRPALSRIAFYSTSPATEDSIPPLTKSAKPAIVKVDPSPAEFKVGQIVNVDYHPDADGLYVSKVDLGNDDSRIVISGLTMHIRKEQLQGRHVVLVSNLKPRKIQGILSEAMLLAGEHTDLLEGSESRTVDSQMGPSVVEERLNTVELVDPPKESHVGDQLHFEGFQDTTKTHDIVKPKTWFHIQQYMFINGSRQVAFKVKDDEGKVSGYARLVNSKGEPATLRTLTEGTVR